MPEPGARAQRGGVSHDGIVTEQGHGATGQEGGSAQARSGEAGPQRERFVRLELAPSRAPR